MQTCRRNAKKTPGQRHQRDRVFQEKKNPNKSPLSQVVEISSEFSRKKVNKPDKIFSEKCVKGSKEKYQLKGKLFLFPAHNISNTKCVGFLPHQLSLQLSTKLPHISDVSPQAGPTVLLSDNLDRKGCHDPLLDLDNLLEGLTKLRTGLDLLLLVYYI